MDRIYEQIIFNNLKKYKQMIFLVGPRQVGKTTIAKKIQQKFAASLYLNWDVVEDRQQILSGQKFIQEIFPLKTLRDQKPLIIFDELHKYRDWKNYLKGFYDLYKDFYHIIITGSARLDIYQSGGDSLMGRYFQYSIHPFSVSEIINSGLEKKEHKYFNQPIPIKHESFVDLYNFGGFPDPLIEKNSEYFNLWQKTRFKQLIFEELQTLANIQEIALIEMLAEILKHQSGQLVNKNSLAKKIQVTTQTISRWLITLERFYYCFTVKPWCKNITRSLIKAPKIYLWDWSVIDNDGMKFENFVASHLLKFINFWSEQGYEKFELYYLRDLDNHEVDFLIVKNQEPWLMVEAKSKDQHISKNIYCFQQQLQPMWVLQVIKDLSFSQKSCFQEKEIWSVPATTFLSQLV